MFYNNRKRQKTLILKLLRYFISSFKTIVLPSHLKRGKKILFLTALQSLADVIGLAAIVPVLMLAIDGDFLAKSAKLRYIYAQFNFRSEGQFLLFLIGLMFCFFVFKNWFAIWLQNYIKKVGSTIVAHATRIKYHHFINKEYHEIIHKGTPDFINVVMNIPYHYVTGMVLPFINLFSEILVVALFSFFAFYNPSVFLILIIVLGPAVYLINKATKSKIVNLGIVSGKLREDALNELNLGLSGITEIKMNRVGGFFIERFVQKQFAYAKNEMRSLTFQGIPSRLLEIIALIAVIILVIYGFFFCKNPSEVRILGALFVISIFRLIPAINRILVSLMHLKIYKYTADELLVSAEYNAKHSGKVIFEKTISFKTINYCYENADFPVIKDLNLELSKGDFIGITGESGAGKSTLMKILLQLLKQQSGKILVDGSEISKNNELTWQRMIGYVGQTPYILNGSIIENIALGEVENIDTKEVKNSLIACGLASFSEDLNYLVGENGIKLSEGQKQRLALARVVYKKSKILILDEATSALDDETENLIGKTLQELAKNSITIIIIAHRKNILGFCNQVYQLKEGKLTK